MQDTTPLPPQKSAAESKRNQQITRQKMTRAMEKATRCYLNREASRGGKEDAQNYHPQIKHPTKQRQENLPPPNTASWKGRIPRSPGMGAARGISCTRLPRDAVAAVVRAPLDGGRVHGPRSWPRSEILAGGPTRNDDAGRRRRRGRCATPSPPASKEERRGEAARQKRGSRTARGP